MKNVHDRYLGWSVNDIKIDKYLNSISEILRDESKFENFRNNNSNYFEILEHVSKDMGDVYAKRIVNDHSELLDYLNDFKLNDDVGKPIKYKYNLFGDINPTTLRYIYFAADIYKNLGNLNGYDLIEIGGGYGGLVRILNVLFNFNKIKLFDLDAPLKLQKKYLNEFGIEVDTLKISDEFKINNKTLVVSNFAWSELNGRYRKEYYNKIIKFCDLNYLTIQNHNLLNELKLSCENYITHLEPLGKSLIFIKK